MSSRALRRLKREEEEARQQAALQAEQDADDVSEEGEDQNEYDSTTKVQRRPVANTFDMLDGANEGNSDEEEGEQGVDVKSEDSIVQTTASASVPPKNISANKKKKKKQKKKAKQKDPAEDASRKAVDELDDIDRALKELSTKEPDAPSRYTHSTEITGTGDTESSWEASATKLLGIDSKTLNPVNEMKSLFGNIALEGSSTGRASPRAPQRQREQNQQGGVDLGTALSGRYSPASKGKELGALANRRNVFVQGHEDWPLGTSGGLSMEYDKDNVAFGKHFTIHHNDIYSEVQEDFQRCVESMQAEIMIKLLMLNPYHIATLLQVSEIAKHQGDHSVSGDLLERALFSLGRSVHSSFPAALREGVARLSFADPKNRELYLTMWRYIQNLSMRGTWRTAYEWTKALLQLDTLRDPYGMTLMIDQVALRGRQHAAFIELCSEDAYGDAWSHLPNIQISLALAYVRSSQPKLARQSLALAMHRYPYILSALASSLDISPLPKYLWGKLPATDAEKLYTELYVTRAKDLWNTPETTSLIAEVAETLPHYTSLISSSPPPAKLEISLEDARHIMLLEIPSLIALLPRKFTTMSTSSSDVLPPPDSLSSTFTLRSPASATDPSAASAILSLLTSATAGAATPIGGASGLLTRVLNWFHAPANSNEPLNEHGETDGAAALRELHEHIPPEVVQDMFRMHMLEEGPQREHDHEQEDNRDTDSDQGEVPLGIGDTIRDALFRNIAEGRGADDESDEVSDDGATDSLPELEDIPSTTANGSHGPTFQGPLQRSMAVTVEDDSEDDFDASETEPGAEYLLRAHPLALPNHNVLMPRDPQDRHLPSRNPAVVPRPGRAAPEQDQTSDPQRIQRWLISTGLQRLQEDGSSLGEYVERLKGLRQRDRDWTVAIVRQRAGAEVAEKVTRELAR